MTFTILQFAIFTAAVLGMGVSLGIMFLARKRGHLAEVEISREQLQEVLLAQPEVEREWICHYPEFADSVCLADHNPDATGMPRKHRLCGWALIWPENPEPRPMVEVQ